MTALQAPAGTNYLIETRTMNPTNAKSRGGPGPGSANTTSHPQATSCAEVTAPAAIPAPRQPGDDQSAWWPTIISAITSMAATTDGPWDVDDLRERYRIEEPPAPHMWGLAFGTAVRAGLIQATGAVTVSRRRSRSRGYHRSWVGANPAIPAADERGAA